MKIVANEMHFQFLNNMVRTASENIEIDKCFGQRFIASGLSAKKITITGTPGNALGAYLNGAEIEVFGNAQDAVGDTMNDGKIIIHGNAGDALGYAMRGGKIYVEGNSGYRTGIHIKEYGEKKPIIIVGGQAGSFLGEYMAGGIIIVLGLKNDSFRGDEKVGDFTGTGMHGGKIFIRSETELSSFPQQVSCVEAGQEDLKEIEEYLKDYCKIFKKDYNSIIKSKFYALKPNAKNPYKRLYTNN